MPSPQTQQSVTLDAFLGLLTNVVPEAIPEGGSPLNWDVDFLVGEVGTRAGLVSVYSSIAKPQYLWLANNISGGAVPPLHSILELSYATPSGVGTYTPIAMPAGLSTFPTLGLIYLRGKKVVVTDLSNITGAPINFAVVDFSGASPVIGSVFPFPSTVRIAGGAELPYGPGLQWCVDTSPFANIWYSHLVSSGPSIWGLSEVNSVTGALIQTFALPAPYNQAQAGARGVFPFNYASNDYIAVMTVTGSGGSIPWVCNIFKVSDGSLFGSYTIPDNTGHLSASYFSQTYFCYDGVRYLYQCSSANSGLINEWHLYRIDLAGSPTVTNYTFLVADKVYEIYMAQADNKIIGHTVNGNIQVIDPTSGTVLFTASGLSCTFSDDITNVGSVPLMQSCAVDDAQHTLIVPAPTTCQLRRLNVANLAAISVIDTLNPCLQWIDGDLVNTNVQASVYLP